MHQTALHTGDFPNPDELPTDENPEIHIPIHYTEPKGGERTQRNTNSFIIQLQENDHAHQRDPIYQTQSSIRRFPLQEGQQASENTKQNPGLSLDKKWVLHEICKMRLDNDQVIRTLEYLRELASSLTKEEMLQNTINFLVKDSVVQQVQANAQGSKPVIERIDICAGDVTEEDREEIEKVCCGICFSEVRKTLIKCPLPCQHAYCHDCYLSYLYDKIAANQVLDITCPEVICTSKFEDEHMKLLLSEDVYQKYLQFKQNKELNMNPNVRWCIRPTCGKHIIVEKGSKKVVCECGTEICFTCRNEYHPNRTCEQMMDDTYKEYLVKNDVQKCPHCKARVEKIDGCNHMSCSVCNYQWCWLCGEKYTSDHFQPMNPFGCAGLQRGGINRQKWPRWKIRLYRASIMMLILTLAFILWPLLAALILPVRYNDYLKERKGGSMTKARRCGEGFLTVLLFFASFCILPIMMVVSLTYFVSSLYDDWKKNR